MTNHGKSVRTPAVFSVAEFFAGIGLVRLALERHGFRVDFANDVSPLKQALYSDNFAADDLLLRDVRCVTGADVPDVEVATASFPCTDLSLAGNRAGLAGRESSLLWQFTRILQEMGERKPRVILLENVPGFATSRGGKDMAEAILKLNSLGYTCDAFQLDARHFLPQSRPRLFIVGSLQTFEETAWAVSEIRPKWLTDFVHRNPALSMRCFPMKPPTSSAVRFADHAMRLTTHDGRWWSGERLANFLNSLAPLHKQRLGQLSQRRAKTWVTAYRRTRPGRGAIWEIRSDEMSGCLRTATGGSSKQAVVEAGRGSVRVRWMLAREYAALQGAPNFNTGDLSENNAILGFGDAVCVPVIEYIAANYLVPLLERKQSSESKNRLSHGSKRCAG